MGFINFKNVSFAYRTDEEQGGEIYVNTVLENFDFSVEKGDFVAVLGRNGSGKSTIAKLVNGILTPDSGTVEVDSIVTDSEEHIFDVRRRVGMVFQNPDNQIVASIVEEDVAFGPENLGVPPDEIRQRVDKALKTVNMYDYRLKAPDKLSGGQKQRVAVAGILAMEPECIVLDEPTAMLDPSGRAEVIETALRLNKEQNITIVLITHFMDEAVRAKRVVVVDDGKILLDGTPKEVFKNPVPVKEAGLDVPQVTELMHRLRSNGVNVGDDVLGVDECVKELAKLLEA